MNKSNRNIFRAVALLVTLISFLLSIVAYFKGEYDGFSMALLCGISLLAIAISYIGD